MKEDRWKRETKVHAHQFVFVCEQRWQRITVSQKVGFRAGKGQVSNPYSAHVCDLGQGASPCDSVSSFAK